MPGTRAQDMAELLQPNAARTRHCGGIGCLGHLETVEGHPAGNFRTLTGEQPLLESDEGNGGGRPYGGPEPDTGVAVQTGRYVDAEDGTPAPVDPLDRVREGAFHFPVESGAEHRVHHHVETGEIRCLRYRDDARLLATPGGVSRITAKTRPGTRQFEGHIEPFAGRELREEKAVSAVVAVTAQHGNAARVRPAPAQMAQRRRRRAFHEGDSGNAEERSDGPIESAQLPGAVERVGKLVRHGDENLGNRAPAARRLAPAIPSQYIFRKCSR